MSDHKIQPKPRGEYMESPRNEQIEKQFPHKGGDGMRRGTNPGYSTDAHSSTHHGNDGRAEGSVSDHALPMKTQTQAEGRTHGPGPSHHDGGEHHMGGEAHAFAKPPATMGHSFGHGQHQKAGPLRNSGHSGAHRIGHKRGK